MSVNVLEGDVGGVLGDGALEAAVERHRRQLESLATAATTVETLDRELADLQKRRVEAVAEYERVRNELVSGQAAGEAIAALGLKGVAVGNGRRQTRRPARPARGKREPATAASERSEDAGGGTGDGE